MSPQEATPVFTAGTTGFLARDPEQMAALGAELGWAGEYLAIGRGFEVAVDAAQTERVQLMRVNYLSGSVERGEGPQDTCVFVLSRPSGPPSRLRGEALGQTRLGLVGPGTDYEFYTQTGDDLLVLGVPRLWIEHEAVARWGRPLFAAGNSATLSVAPTSDPTGLIDACSSRLHAVLQRPDRLRRSGDVTLLESVLLGTLFETLASPIDARPQPTRREVARRAEAFLRANACHPIKMTDLCRKIGAAERTLQDGFREVYGTSPMTYLRTLRLQSAQALLATAGSEQSISRVALGCGFSHLGRFSVAYHEHFGETPSETRSRASGFLVSWRP